MPTRKTFAPRGRPTHDVFRRSFLPQCEIERIALISLTVERPGIRKHVIQHAARQFTVMIVCLHVEIDRSVTFISESVFQNLPGHLDLLDDMSRSMGLDARRKHIERTHRIVVAVRIVLCDLHRLQLLKARLLADLVLSLVGIALQMPHVGNVAHIAHFVTEAAKVPEQQIKRNRRTGMSQMRIAVDSRSTDIKSYERRFERNELLFATGKGIVNAKFRVHMYSFSAG